MKTLIFGGAFDPPHNEHVRLCASAIAQLKIDRLVAVPTFYPPHKGAGFLSFEERCTLAQIAFGNLTENFAVDPMESQTGGENYTSDNLPILKQKYGDIIYLIGGDSLINLSKWHNPKGVLSVCPLAVGERNGYCGDIKKLSSETEKKFGGRIITLDFEGENISSSVLRAKLLLGLKTPELQEKVKEYIVAHGLFSEYKGMAAQLKTYQSDELFDHSMHVVLKAVDINSKADLRQDFDEVFTAALLHDNAKERKTIDGLDVPKDAEGSPVMHQFLGAEKARRDFGITNERILDGIRYHTSAKPAMTTFEKLIYTADSVSDDRTYEPIPQLSKIVAEDFEKGFLAVLKYTYDYVIKRGRPMYHLTQEAYDYYLKNNILNG